MASASTPALAAAVSNAGGLGSLGLARASPDEIIAAIQALRGATNRAFNINLFAPLGAAVDRTRLNVACEALEPYYGALGLALPPMPKPPPFNFEDQLAAVLAEKPPVVSFTFERLSAPAIAAIKKSGALLIGTATTVEEARALTALGVDAIVAQGAEAGGHRGTFLGPFDRAMIGLTALVPAIIDATGLPVIAAGGVMDGRGVVASLALGAAAVQLGTAFLACPENTVVNPVYLAAVTDPSCGATTVTPAYTGRPARMIANRFTSEMAQHLDTLAPFPLQGALTRPMVEAAIARRVRDFIPMLAGQGAGRARALPAARLVETLVAETMVAIEALRAGR
jgi:nitronate monooxygenase